MLMITPPRPEATISRAASWVPMKAAWRFTEHLVEEFIAHFQHAGCRRDAGVVEHYVEPPEFSDRALDERLDRLALRHVGRDENRVRALRAQRRRRRFARRRVDVSERDPGAVGREAARAGEADAIRRAGDDSGLAGQASHFVNSSCLRALQVRPCWSAPQEKANLVEEAIASRLVLQEQIDRARRRNVRREFRRPPGGPASNGAVKSPRRRMTSVGGFTSDRRSLISNSPDDIEVSRAHSAEAVFRFGDTERYSTGCSHYARACSDGASKPCAACAF